MAYETESPLSTGVANNSTSSANTLSSGVQMVGALGSSSDVDYFKINTDGPALIKLDFLSDLLSATDHWQVRLLDGNGDYLRTLASSVSGTPAVNGSNQSSTSLAVDGLGSLPAIGSRFTFVTASADTSIYTVTSATALSAGASTLTLNQAPSTAPTDNTVLAFDPAQAMVAQTGSLTAQVSAAGTYYVEVLADGAVWNASDYRLTASVLSTAETEAGDSSSQSFDQGKALAVEYNNRLAAGVNMTGALASATDVDYWVFTTARPSDFTVSFAAASGSDTTPQWKVDVTEWSGAVLPNNAGALTAGTSASVSIDDANYPTAKTFVVKVSATSSSVYNTGAYTLRVAGTGLDLNDAPVLTMGTVSSSSPDLFVNSNKVQTISVGSGAGATPDGTAVALNSLFSVSDPDSGQSISSYRLSLTKAQGVSSSAYIRVGDVGSYSYYGFGGSSPASSANVSLTAAQMSTASFFAGTTAGDLSLAVQAFDSSGAADGSGNSAIVQQTLHLVSGSYGVTVGSPSATNLTENLTPAAGAPHAATFSLVLTAAPTQDVKIYLTDSNDELDAFKVNGTSSNLVTFTASNWNQAQTVTVTASNDGVSEGSGQAAPVGFQVVSTDSNYDGYAMAALSFSVSDNAAPTLSTPNAISYTDTSANDSFANATGSLAGSDSNGDALSYGISGGTSSVDGLSVSKQGSYGSLTVVKATGAYTFVPNDAAIEALNSGSTSESFTVTVSDGMVSSPTSATLSVNLTGANEAAGQAVSVLAYSWKTHTLLDGVSVSYNGGAAQTTASGGAASFSSVSETNLSLSASLSANSDASSAVNLQDAISVLKMVVGLDVNGSNRALSPYQLIAADYDADGTVSLVDAINVLKHVVGLSAPDPAWVFTNEADTSVPALASGLSGKTVPALAANVAGDATIGLVGVLRGDVDGSWSAPQGSRDLDETQPTYFTDLVTSLDSAHHDVGFNAAQWGIYA